MNVNSVKRVFASVRPIINLNIGEYRLEDTNAFSGAHMPDGFDTPIDLRFLVMQKLHLYRVILHLVSIMILQHLCIYVVVGKTYPTSKPEANYGNAYDFNYFCTIAC